MANGNCKECGEWKLILSKGLCRKCYNSQPEQIKNINKYKNSPGYIKMQSEYYKNNIEVCRVKAREAYHRKKKLKKLKK